MKEALLVNIRSLLLTVSILSSSTFQALAYYHPDEGRWLSRDPISIRGGRNFYSYTRNNPSTYWDYLGLLAVTHDHPDPAKVVPEMAGSEFFAGRNFWQPFEKPDPLRYGGWTGFPDKKVKCGCDCVTNQQGKITGWTMSCTVSWKARIVLNSGWKRDVPQDEPFSLTGAFGHEQRHVKGAVKLVKVKVVDPLSKENGSFASKGLCDIKASRNENFWSGVLDSTLYEKAEHHRDKHPGDDAYSDMPNSGERVDPLPNSPTIPGG